uniref:Potassium channel blocker pMeKTx3-1 n=1 Tax=Mesobuthus eupeus TaxID=34648 RepID=A0A088D9U7_MESEU|nr:potassium channel blocker pMeKTx3-1 [Mesobuthus eupeus]
MNRLCKITVMFLVLNAIIAIISETKVEAATCGYHDCVLYCQMFGQQGKCRDYLCDCIEKGRSNE